MKNIVALFFLVGGIARANVVGTEYQNFNPSISGADFTTVHSSETVKECFCNFGLYFNWAKNTLTYSDNFYATNTDLKNVRANDFLVGADLYAAFGMSKNWDLGVALPFIVTAKNDDPYGVSYIEDFGISEVRPTMKYRFYGDDSGGAAVIASANFNMIRENPFLGTNPGPTINLELAVDTSTSGGWKFAANVGYRNRDSGPQLRDSQTNLPAPFIPFGDAFIYSGAIAKSMGDSTDLIGEIKGSTASGSGTDSTKTSQSALEFGLGLRHQWNPEVDLQFGGGTKLNNAQATPDVRIYAGLNFDYGPICDDGSNRDYPIAIVRNYPRGGSAVTKLKMPVSSNLPETFESYRYKIGSTPDTNCYEEKDYSAEIGGQLPIITDIGEIPDGGVTLCAVAKDNKQVWQPFMNPTIINWSKGKAPIAVVQNHPVSVSDKIDLKMPVTAVNPNDYSAYRWKIGATPDTNCKSERDYSSEIPGQMPIVTDIGPIPDGGITLCAVAKSNSGIWQPFSMPTVVQWEKKKGYELFRLSANVLFDFDKDELQQRSFGELEKVNLHLSRRPYARVVIEGHTDSFGTDQYNVDLSQRRAARVMNYMIEKYKWDAKKIKTMHMGEKFPVDTNETDEGRANNRRVEFKIFRK
jgi:outer membrane protein OmpA-like peptidoglycan-associated protein